MIWDLLITLTVIFAATGLVFVLRPRLIGRPAPVKRIPLVQPHTGRHAATARTHAGGRYTATMPRRDAPPLTEQAIIVQRPGRPWETYPQPVLNDDAETLRLYERGEQATRGNWGTMPAERVIAAELPKVIAL